MNNPETADNLPDLITPTVPPPSMGRDPALIFSDLRPTLELSSKINVYVKGRHLFTSLPWREGHLPLAGRVGVQKAWTFIDRNQQVE